MMPLNIGRFALAIFLILIETYAAYRVLDSQFNFVVEFCSNDHTPEETILRNAALKVFEGSSILDTSRGGRSQHFFQWPTDNGVAAIALQLWLHQHLDESAAAVVCVREPRGFHCSNIKNNGQIEIPCDKCLSGEVVMQTYLMTLVKKNGRRAISSFYKRFRINPTTGGHFKGWRPGLLEDNKIANALTDLFSSAKDMCVSQLKRSAPRRRSPSPHQRSSSSENELYGSEIHSSPHQRSSSPKRRRRLPSPLRRSPSPHQRSPSPENTHLHITDELYGSEIHSSPHQRSSSPKHTHLHITDGLYGSEIDTTEAYHIDLQGIKENANYWEYKGATSTRSDSCFYAATLQFLSAADLDHHQEDMPVGFAGQLRSKTIGLAKQLKSMQDITSLDPLINYVKACAEEKPNELYQWETNLYRSEKQECAKELLDNIFLRVGKQHFLGDTRAIDVSHVPIKPHGDYRKDLIAILAFSGARTHGGQNAEEGHYVAFVKRQGKWLLADGVLLFHLSELPEKKLRGSMYALMYCLAGSTCQ